MRWRARSIRNPGESAPDGEAVLRPIPGLDGMELAGADPSGLSLSGSGLSRSGSSASGLPHVHARSGGNRPGARPDSAPGRVPSEDANSGPETANSAQPSGGDRVEEDM